jgi:hypothetical protein
MRAPLAVGLLAWAAVACGEAADNAGSEAGAPVLFMVEHRTEESPLGVWCFTASGGGLRAQPVVPPELAERAAGGLLYLGGQPWLIYREQTGAWAAPLDGCEVGPPASVSASAEVAWANAAAVYLDDDADGVLRLATPGDGAVEVDSPVGYRRWSPASTAAWYARQTALEGAPSELFVIDLGVPVDVRAAPLALGGYADGPVWSPDGQWLFYLTPTAELRVWSRAEGATRLLVAYAEAPISLSASPHRAGSQHQPRHRPSLRSRVALGRIRTAGRCVLRAPAAFRSQSV